MWPPSRSPAMLIVALILLVALVAASAPPRATPARIAVLELTSGPSASARPFVVAFQPNMATASFTSVRNEADRIQRREHLAVPRVASS
jgi:hypothetical protein